MRSRLTNSYNHILINLTVSLYSTPATKNQVLHLGNGSSSSSSSSSRRKIPLS
ncbi:hypothetical protein HC762_00350 [bacterium]|nr:hypothetical protein [bacterium]